MKKVYLSLLICFSIFKVEVYGQTIWNGPTINYSQASATGPVDQITADIWLTRGGTQGIYNSKSESSYTSNISPQGTEWAYGTLANYATLSYAPWEIWNGKKPPTMLNRDAVLHLINENIYISIKFLSWEIGRQGGDGGFSYQRSSAPTLPVTLKSFSASLRNNTAVLEWRTATEINNQYFDIEHSTNSIDFTSIGRVSGNGNSATDHSYSFTQNNVTSGKHYYRLAQHDGDGNIKYSQVILLSLSSKNTFQLRPNPATSIINITASTSLSGALYYIHTSSGQLIKRGTLNSQQLNVQELSTGQYWLSIQSENGEVMKTSFIKK